MSPDYRFGKLGIIVGVEVMLHSLFNPILLVPV